MALRARWIPRLQNEEADALSNFVFDGFDDSRRIDVDLHNLDFILMNDLFREGDEYISDLAKIKESEQARVRSKPQAAGPGKKRRWSALKDTAPC